jgi:F-type H+-transporting ATPase subunit delta
MEDRRLARRYAAALFGAAKAHDVVGSVESDLATIVNLLNSDPQFRTFVIAPYSSREEKTAIIERVFSDRITAITMQLLRVMLEKRREHEILSVYAEFVNLRRENESVVSAVITSAEPLDEGQRTKIVDRLEAVLNKRIEPEYRVDHTLIGGVRVNYENYVLDGTVRGALSKLRSHLSHDLLKQV